MRKYLSTGFKIRIEETFADVSTYEDIADGGFDFPPNSHRGTVHVTGLEQAIEAIRKYFKR